MGLSITTGRLAAAIEDSLSDWRTRCRRGMKTWSETHAANEVIMSKPGILREVNIKAGLPTVDEAIRKITYNIKNAGPMGVSAIKLIHGYGSSGKGGGIRTESRKYLDRQKSRGQITGYIIGENFSIFDDETRKAFSVCDDLRRDSDLDRHNNGITIVIL